MYMLWTEKYKPRKISEIIGQDKAIAEALQFLKEWKKGSALLFSGPPGVGKTLLAEIIAEESNFQLVQLNASDERTAKEIETLSGATKQKTLFKKGKLILIDEIDGISGMSDRGAVPAILKIIRESEYPVILTANNPYNPKLSMLKRYCKHIKFPKLKAVSISKKLREIAERENIKVEEVLFSNIADLSNGDMRSAITDFQTASKLSDTETLGFRDRLRDIFSTLSVIFFSKDINACRKIMRETDMDPDEIFLWIETNIPRVFKHSGEIAKAYDILSKADIFRGRVMKQQNWRFKLLMSDLMSAISINTSPERKFVPFQYPDKIAQMGRTKFKRVLRESMCKKLGRRLHASSRKIKDELPYIKLIAGGREREFMEEFELSKEEIEMISSSNCYVRRIGAGR